MIHRYCLSLLLFLLVFTLPILSSHTVCPYDLNAASHLILAICYANATAAAVLPPSPTLAAGLFSSPTFMPPSATPTSPMRPSSPPPRPLPVPPPSPPPSSAMASFVLPSSIPTTPANPFVTSAPAPPCLYRTVSTIRSAIDLSNASLACTAFQYDLFANQSTCIDCRNTFTIASLDLFNVTKGKEFSYDMAETIGIWSLAFPSFLRFRSYAACMLQSSMDISILVTCDLVPSPPPPSSLLLPVPSSSRTIKITIGSTVAVVAFIVTFVILAVLLYRSWRQRSTMDDSDRRVPISYSLPT